MAGQSGSTNDGRVAKKGRAGIEQLVVDHHAGVYRYAFRLAGSVADAEDLTQEAFLLAHQRLDQLREVSKARSWLLKITRNCFLQSLQRQRRMTVTADGDLEDVATELPEEPFDLERLQQALDDLPDLFRVVVLMHYFEYLPYREIAEELDLPIGTVMSRLARAKQRLRLAMTRTEIATKG